MQATFVEGGVESYALLGSDADHETITKIVETTKHHGREHTLLWDVLSLVGIEAALLVRSAPKSSGFPTPHRANAHFAQ